MPKSKNKILKKVLAHLHSDSKGHIKEAKEDVELSKKVKPSKRKKIKKKK